MRYKESEKLELKSSFSEWKEIVVALSAFANKKGGKVIIGLDDDGDSAGIQIGKGTIEDFVNKIKNHTDPVLYPSVNIKTFGLGEMVEVEVSESDNKPVFAFDRAYVRVGKTNQKMSQSAVKELIKRYALSDFDKMHLEKAIRDVELDDNLIQKMNKEYFGFKLKAPIDFLEKLGLVSKNKITNAGYLCFVKSNTEIYNARIKMARFKGQSIVKFLDEKEFDGNIIQAVDQVMDFIKRHINTEFIITGKPRRDSDQNI
jgi:ATP-dependent DNA helicase RecG